MQLIRIAVTRPVLTSVLICILVVMGWQSYYRLGLEFTPDMDLPFVTVQTIYPGAGPEEVESQVSKKIEDQIATLSELKKLKSTSMDSVSVVFIEFNVGVDVDLKAIEVKDKVDRILFELPQDAEKPSVEVFNPNSDPIIQLNLVSNRSAKENFEIADTLVSDRLSQVPGVGSIELTGGREREIQILVDPKLAQGFGLSLGMISNLVAAENLNVPSGRVIRKADEYAIRMIGQFASIEEIKNISIPLSSGQVIHLADVASVVDDVKLPRSDAFFSGGEFKLLKQSVNVGIIKKSGANTVSTAEGVKEAVLELRQDLPVDVSLVISNDTSIYIKDAARETAVNIVIGIVLASFLIFIFLHSTRSTFIVAITMPAAMIGTFLFMDFTGFTLNIVTLIALGAAIGTLVTNTIVVLESIRFHLEQGKSPEDAAVEGTSGVAVAVFASTMTNVVVFTPIAFMAGLIGIIFKQFGITLIYTTAISLFMSFTLVPMAAAKLMRPRIGGTGPRLHWFGQTFENLFSSFKEDYRGVLTWCMKHRVKTLAGSTLLFFVGVSLLGFVGTEFVAFGDEGLATIVITLPMGSSLEEIERVEKEVDQKIRQVVPELKAMTYTIGGQSKGVEEGTIILDVGPAAERDRPISEIVDDIRMEMATIPAAEISVLIGVARGHTSSDIEINIVGPEFADVLAAAEKVKGIMKSIDGLADVSMDYKPGKPEIAFRPDRDQISRYGLTSAQVAMEIRAAYEGNVASLYRDKGQEYDIRVMLPESDRIDPDMISSLIIHTPAGPVPLTQLGRLVPSIAKSKITRQDRSNIISIFANISQGTLGELQQQISDQATQLDMGTAKLKFGGFGEIMEETFASMIAAMTLATILTFLVLAGIQESVLHPFTVMITLPLGAAGAAMGLFLSGVSLNMMSLMALVMLIGIVVNNAILIYDYTQQLRNQGMAMKDALVEAAVTRLRPIVMMNLAIAISMAPQALGGAGAELRQGMAVVTIGGVIVSMVFTLVLFPVLFTLIDRVTVRGRKETKQKSTVAVEGTV